MQNCMEGGRAEVKISNVETDISFSISQAISLSSFSGTSFTYGFRLIAD